MKKSTLILFILISFKISSQELFDRIYKKDGDSILCNITSVEKNWIYYDHKGKKGMRNDYIHMSEIKYYFYKYIYINPPKREVRSVALKQKINEDSLKYSIQDSLLNTIEKEPFSTFYLDSLGKKQPCSILLNTGEMWIKVNQYRKIEIIDSLGKRKILFPSHIHGYWLNGTFYRSFKIIHKGKKVDFFAEELVIGKALLYLYNGEQLDHESIYIFKKQSETDFIFVHEFISKKSHYGQTEHLKPQVGSFVNSGISFYDEKPYLEYLQYYLSDCKEVLLKFKYNWYTYNDIVGMFRDYNNCK